MFAIGQPTAQTFKKRYKVYESGQHTSHLETNAMSMKTIEPEPAIDGLRNRWSKHDFINAAIDLRDSKQVTYKDYLAFLRVLYKIRYTPGNAEKSSEKVLQIAHK